MASAEITDNDGNRRYIKTSKNVDVILEIDDEWTEIIFRTGDGERFGEFYFKEIDDDTYKLTRMYTEPHQNSGIGKAALQFFKDKTGRDIVVSPNDGQIRDDSSHLTQDAPVFVNKMIKKYKLIAGYYG